VTTITRERLPDYPKELPDRPRQSKRRATSTDKRFTVLPRAFVLKPGRYGLTVYETGILAALIAGARMRDSEDRRAIADKAKAEMFAKSMKRTRDTKQAGTDSRNAFRNAMREQRTEWAPPDTLSFRAYPTELHKMAGLATSTASLAKLDDALTRLQTKIASGLPPPLVKATRLKLGRYRFVVNSDWLASPYRRVNLPLPTKSLNATNLYLFMRTQGGKPQSIAEVCKAIGIKSRKLFEQRLMLKRAFDIANDKYIQHSIHNRAKGDMPAAWRLDWDGSDRVRFWPGIPREDAN
jgi:hypothetical protein